MKHLKDNLAQVEQQIHDACARAGRARDDVQLVAVSKGHPAASIAALRDLGVQTFGESYVQEWQEKARKVAEVDWHFIGHLQSNKARFLVEAPPANVALIHSVDRASVLKALASRADQPVSILLQVNIGADPAKSGAAADETRALLQRAIGYDALTIRGLMAIPPLTDAPDDARPHFHNLANLFHESANWLAEHAPQRRAAFTELSIGMSNDFGIAIEEGATIIRVGTALFGAR